MKIAFDTSPLHSAHQGRGVGTYTRELMLALKKLNTPHEFIFTNNPRQLHVDLVHYPYFDLFYHTLPIFKKAKTIVTIHDVIPLIYPQFFPKGIKGSMGFTLQKLSLLSVSAVITDSSSSQTDISLHLAVPPSRIHPIHLGVSAQFKPATASQKNQAIIKYSLPKKYLLYVGDINFNKNLSKTIVCLHQFKNVHLVIVSRADFNSHIPEAIAIKKVIHQYGLQSRIHLISVSSTSDLIAIYSAAFYYIQPSLYEGFGLPILEAFACGTPVMCANTSSLPEVAGNAAIYFDPLSSTSISNALKQALHLSPTKRTQLFNRAKHRRALFSWEQTALATIKVYESVLS